MIRKNNAKYTSKTIQNEIVSVAADLYHNYIREWLTKCPYFSIIAAETTSQGRLVFSICIRLLDFHGDPSNPCKREFLLDICDLLSTTGEAIANVIRDICDLPCSTGEAIANVIRDICDLPCSTGEAIANVIRETLKKHKINIADCKGQAYSYSFYEH